MGDIVEEKQGGSSVWHVGKHFSLSHVLMPLLEARKLVKKAQFGTENPLEELNMPPSAKNWLRLNCLQRLKDEILQMAEDIVFIMDKNTLADLEENVIKPVTALELKNTYSYTQDERSKNNVLVINEKSFNEALDKLRKALSHIKTPQNRKNLIFPAGEDFDLDDLKKDIIEGG